MLVKILVPSRARAESFHEKTFKLLKDCTLPWGVVIDPQDYEDYSQFVPTEKLIRVKSDNLGFGFALDAMRKHCFKYGILFCWKIDDDVHHVYSSSKTLPKHLQPQLLSAVVERVLQPAHKLFGKLLGGISFSQTKAFHTDWSRFTHVNKMFEGIYIVRAANWFTPINSRGLNEEPFASAKLILDRLISLRTGMLAWSHDMSTLPGGLQLVPNRDKQQGERYAWMQKTYPHVMSLMQSQQYEQKDGRVFTVVDKKDFNRRHSVKLPLKSNAEERFSEEVVRLLSKLPQG